MLLFAVLACSPCESWEYLAESGECIAFESLIPVEECESWEYQDEAGACQLIEECEPRTGSRDCAPIPYECDIPGDVMECNDSNGRLTYEEPCTWWVVYDGTTRTDLDAESFAAQCWPL